MIKITFDKEARVMYIQLSKERVEHTEAIGGPGNRVNIDYNLSSEIVGIEILFME